jgi:hypothetical protein
MVVNDQFVMTAQDVEAIQGKALLAHKKAKQNLNLLLSEVDQLSNGLRHVAGLLDELKSSEDFLHGPVVAVLQLPEMTYGEKQCLKTVKALAASVAVALRQVSEAYEHIQKVGA